MSTRFNRRNATETLSWFYRIIICSAMAVTICVLVLLYMNLSGNAKLGMMTFLMTASSNFAIGGMIGFLFAIPRAEKKRFTKAENDNNLKKDNDYKDNTNLEEISDWITKIIVGISLIKFRVILGWIDSSAERLATTTDFTSLNLYTFYYAIIIFYFLLGACLFYLWTRIDLWFILMNSKKMARVLEDNNELIGMIQRVMNDKESGLLSTEPKQISSSDTVNKKVKAKESSEGPDLEFRAETERIYNSKRILDKDDLQRGRWGGKPLDSNILIEAVYDPVLSIERLCSITIIVKSLDVNKKMTGEVAFFLHDTFTNPIQYAMIHENKAQIRFLAWEAFVVGARLKGGIELELDLNTVKGFPSGFYWSNK